MRVEGCAEYSNSGKADWLPFISILTGTKKLIHALYCAIFSAKAEPQVQSSPSLNQRVQFWSEQKRGAIALIPFFGNALIIWHDYRVNQGLNELEDRLRTANTRVAVERIFSEFPDEVKNSESTMRSLIKVNPEILEYSHLRNDANFMLKAVVQNVENLRYAPVQIMMDRTFTLSLIKGTDQDLDLFTSFPQLIKTFGDDPEVMLEIAKRNPAHLQYAPKLMEDENFVLNTAQTLYDESFQSYAYGQPKNRPHYQRELDILCYAPKLCQNKSFLLRAKSQPYLNPLKYATPHFSDNGDFILKMMAGYRIPGGWFASTSGNGIQFGRVVQTLPLEKIASNDLKNNLDFMKRAIEIDNESWRFASEIVQAAIFEDREFIARNCSDFSLMTEALKRDRYKIDLVSASLIGDPRFKQFVRENYPISIYKQLYE